MRNLPEKILPALAESYDIFEFYFPHLKPKTIQLAKQTGKELWSYYIPAKVTSPLAYRSMGIKNFQAGFSGVACILASGFSCRRRRFEFV